MLDSKTIEIIKSTVPVLEVHANAITEHFYPLLFDLHPEVIPYFNQTNQGKGTQPKALANAVVAYGANIDQLGNLSEAVKKIVHKHTSLGILPAHYDVVGACLIQAIKEVLGGGATEEVLNAWSLAYSQLAEILIDAEESVYKANESSPGGWRGEREFTLVNRVDESSIITSYYFEPTDNMGVPIFEAGQFITLVLDDVNGAPMRRNYSLSDAPGKKDLRISVKREPQGSVSNYLYDHLQIGDCVKLRPPCGDFVLRKNGRPLVLLTGGVGITPAISMLNEEVGSGRQIYFIHAALNSHVHAFRTHVDQLSKEFDNVFPFYVYSEPSPMCDSHAKGYINKEMVVALLPQNLDVEFYFLGPKPFMIAASKIAEQLNFPKNQVHYEFFGPSEELIS
ncbi:Flavohemoprotein [Thalassocella blandensis]|nr:Flavohemoprotein [Thalassocella blandensis]